MEGGDMIRYHNKHASHDIRLQLPSTSIHRQSIGAYNEPRLDYSPRKYIIRDI